MDNYFCGWYYKCQSKEQTLALIPALHISEGRRSCSLQLISNKGNWNIPLSAPDAEIQPNKPVSVFENAAFHEDGIDLSIHEKDFTATGSLQFSGLTPHPI